VACEEALLNVIALASSLDTNQQVRQFIHSHATKVEADVDTKTLVL
jgi:hypothetical protein